MEASGRSFHTERPSGFPGLKSAATSPLEQDGVRGSGESFSKSLVGAGEARDAQRAQIKGRHDSHRDAGPRAEADGRAAADRRAESKRAEERTWDRHDSRRRAGEARRQENDGNEAGEELNPGANAAQMSGAVMNNGSPGRGAGQSEGRPTTGIGAVDGGSGGTGGARSPQQVGALTAQPGYGVQGTARAPVGPATMPGMHGAGTPTSGSQSGAYSQAGLGQGAANGLSNTQKAGPAPSLAAEAGQVEVANAEAEQRAARGADILRQIRLNLTGAAREVSLQLRPAELGHIKIRLGVEDGTARAEVLVENKETMDLLAEHLPELRAALAERGLDSGELNLDHGGGPANWGLGDRADEQLPVARENLVALAEATAAGHTDWLDPEVGVDLYA